MIETALLDLNFKIVSSWLGGQLYDGLRGFFRDRNLILEPSLHIGNLMRPLYIEEFSGMFRYLNADERDPDRNLVC